MITVHLQVLKYLIEYLFVSLLISDGLQNLQTDVYAVVCVSTRGIINCTHVVI
jgi:hypothetical protein